MPLSSRYPQPSVGTYGGAQTYPQLGAAGPLIAGRAAQTRGTGTNVSRAAPAAAPAPSLGRAFQAAPVAGDLSVGPQAALLARLGALPPSARDDLAILADGSLEGTNPQTGTVLSVSPGQRPAAGPQNLAGLPPGIVQLLRSMPHLAALLNGGLPRPRRRRPAYLR